MCKEAIKQTVFNAYKKGYDEGSKDVEQLLLSYFTSVINLYVTDIKINEKMKQSLFYIAKDIYEMKERRIYER